MQNANDQHRLAYFAYTCLVTNSTATNALSLAQASYISNVESFHGLTNLTPNPPHSFTVNGHNPLMLSYCATSPQKGISSR